jgi:transposase
MNSEVGSRKSEKKLKNSELRIPNSELERSDSEWLAQVQSSQITSLVNFAQGLMQDYDAVKSAMILPWSNGPVEGQINRLKMLKRQMYGRASLELLTRRFLWAI